MYVKDNLLAYVCVAQLQAITIYMFVHASPDAFVVIARSAATWQSQFKYSNGGDCFASFAKTGYSVIFLGDHNMSCATCTYVKVPLLVAPTKACAGHDPVRGSSCCNGFLLSQERRLDSLILFIRQ